MPTQQLAEVEVVGPTWYPQHLLTLNTTNTTDRFGTAASVSGNYALVGAAYDAPMGDARGAAYVFAWDGAGWVVDAAVAAASTRAQKPGSSATTWAERGECMSD